MDQATISAPMLDQAESPTAAMISRDQDALSQALRHGNIDDVRGIAKLNRETSPVHDALSSLEPSSTTVFTSHESSTITKPTSITPSYPPMKPNNKGKQKLKVSHASSLSGTHGSASDADAEGRDFRRISLLALGSWATEELTPGCPLKGGARARERIQHRSQARHKKVEIVLTHEDDARMPLLEHNDQVSVSPVGVYGSGNSPSHPLGTKYSGNSLHLSEEGNVRVLDTESITSKSLSRIRVISLAALVVFMTATLAIAACGVYYLGKGRKSCTKGVVFVATALMVCFTIPAMLIARRPVLEALLAGLLELIFGLTLLLELDDFM